MKQGPRCPCRTPNPGPAEFLVGSGHCYACWCWYYREDIRVAWGGPKEPPPLPTGERPRQTMTGKFSLEIVNAVRACPDRKQTEEKSCGCQFWCHRYGKKAEWNKCVECIKHGPMGTVKPPAHCLVAIGCYGPMSPGVIELQIKLIRKHNGPNQPILVHDDHSETAHDHRVSEAEAKRQRKRLVEICRRERVMFRSSPRRLGHGGGDLSAMWHGLRAAKKLGIPYVWKLSFRFLIDVPNWIDSALIKWEKVEKLYGNTKNGSPIVLSTHYCGVPWYVFPYRTECVGLRVSAFDKPMIMDVKSGLLAPRSLAAGREHNPAIAEPIFAQAVYAAGGGTAVSPDWLGPARNLKYPGIVWHDVPGSGPEYQELAEREGVNLGPYFHAGWSRDTPNYSM